MSLAKTPLLAVPFVLLACASTPPASEPADVAASASAADAPSVPSMDSAAPNAGSPTASPDAPKEAPKVEGPAEAAKDPNALVLELTAETQKGALNAAELDKLKAALVEQVAKSSKVAFPTSKGVSAGRHVITRLIAGAPTEAKNGLTQKVQLNGVTSDGKCPLFDLNAQATLSDGKKSVPADLEAVRAAAVVQVFEKLEAEAPTLKPSSSCSPEGKKKP